MISENKKHTILFWVSMITICLGILLMSSLYYMYFLQDMTPIVVKNEPIPVTLVNDDIILHMDICKYTDAPATLYLSFVDGIMFTIPPQRFAGLNKGECGMQNLMIELPTTIPKGEYHIHARSVYKINSLTERVVEWGTENFVLT
jgi:hypothetical protein